MKPKRILSLFTTIALLAGLFITPAFADNGSNQDLQQYLSILGDQPYEKINGVECWAHFDQGELVYGFPSDVTGLAQGYDQAWKTATASNGQDWETANADDAAQAPSDDTNWQNGIANGLQNSDGHSGQEPRYLGYDTNGEPVSNINFPPDTSGLPNPAQCQLIERPWDNIPGDPDYGDGNGGWPKDATTSIPPYTWGVIMGAIQNANSSFGYPGIKNSFMENSAFATGLTPTVVQNYFEMIVMPEPGITGEIRFWNESNGAYYKDIDIPWLNGALPDYYVTSLTPFAQGQPQGTYSNGERPDSRGIQQQRPTIHLHRPGNVWAETNRAHGRKRQRDDIPVGATLAVKHNFITGSYLWRSYCGMRQLSGQLCHNKAG